MNLRQLATRVDPGLHATSRGSPAPPAPAADAAGPTFADALAQAEKQLAPSLLEVKLSAHAQERILQRGIALDDAQRQALGQAMQQLEAKGARDALLLRDDAAFVVNVPSRTVVTAAHQDELQERIFTQIDSVMLLAAAQPTEPTA